MQSLTMELEKYIQKTSGEDIRQICDPVLSKFGITYFLYVKSFDDGSRMWLTTMGEWTDHFYRNEYYNISAFEDPQGKYPCGYFLWNGLPGQSLYNHAREFFNIDHGLTIVNRLDNAYEYAHFGTSRENHHVVHFYLNNIEFLNNFILYFRDKGAGLIQRATTLRVPLPKIQHGCGKTNLLLPYQDIRIVLNKNKIILSEAYDNVKLSKREYECIDLLKQGISLREISERLRISCRTAETHLENIKRKLKCDNIFQLGYKIAEIDKHRV